MRQKSVPASCITLSFSYWNFARACLKLQGLDDPGFDSLQGQNISCSPKLPDCLWGPPSPLSNGQCLCDALMYPWNVCVYVCMYVCMNRPGLEADHLPTSSADLSVRGATFLFFPQNTFTLTFSTAFTNRTVF